MSEKLRFRCKFLGGENIKVCSAQGPYEADLEKPSLAKNLKGTKAKTCIAATLDLPPSNCDFFIKRRPDQTDKLGKPLTSLQEALYRAIYRNDFVPISPVDLYQEVYKRTPEGKKIHDMPELGNLLHRTRRKLGFNSIILHEDSGGYVAKRAFIEANPGNRDPQEAIEELRQEL
jgi:hypothetical protein